MHSNFHNVSRDMIEQGAQKCAKREIVKDPLGHLASQVGPGFVAMLQTDRVLQEILGILPVDEGHKRRMSTVRTSAARTHEPMEMSLPFQQRLAACVASYELPVLTIVRETDKVKVVDRAMLTAAFVNRYLTLNFSLTLVVLVVLGCRNFT